MNVLLTSCGRRSYLIEFFKEVLHAEGGRVFASNSIYTNALSHADGHFITPGIYEDGYIEALLRICRDNGISVIISLFDIDLPVLSKNRERFAERGVRVIVSAPEVIDICNDKWKTACYLKEQGIAHPQTYLSVEEALEHLAFPMIVKPRWGMGSISVQKAETKEELAVLFEKVKRDLFRSYLKYESASDAERCVLVQECIQGKEYGLDVVNDLQGNHVGCIVKHKIAMRAGETDEAVIVDSPELQRLGAKIAAGLRHIGNLDVDCFVAGEKAYVLELNCRFGGQYPFSHLAGANLPAQIIRWAQGGDTVSEWCTAQPGVRSCKELVPTRMNNPE